MTSLLIGNIVTSVLRNHATPLQIALGVHVLINRKKIIKHMFDYKVTCSYDELRRYKKSSAVARCTKLRREERIPITVSGLIQHIADNFDADMSLAMIECFPELDNTNEPQSFHRISKDEMKKPVHYDEHEDDFIPFRGEGNPLPPHYLLQNCLTSSVTSRESRMKGLEKWILNLSR